MGTRLQLAVVSTTDIALFSLLAVLVVAALIGMLIFEIWKQKRPPSLSPYSRQPLQSAVGLPYDVAEKVLRYMYNLHQYDNRIFELRRAAICRETGRIFIDALNWHNTIKVEWDFLQKRYPGQYVSWGSLTEERQAVIAALHESLDDFQTAFSSPYPQPRLIEAKYALSKPGPLYVDLQTNVLLGWKLVPGTDVEVLIVQKPLNIITPGLNN